MKHQDRHRPAVALTIGYMLCCDLPKGQRWRSWCVVKRSDRLSVCLCCLCLTGRRSCPLCQPGRPPTMRRPRPSSALSTIWRLSVVFSTCRAASRVPIGRVCARAKPATTSRACATTGWSRATAKSGTAAVECAACMCGCLAIATRWSPKSGTTPPTIVRSNPKCNGRGRPRRDGSDALGWSGWSASSGSSSKGR